MTVAANKDHSYFRSQIPWPILRGYLEGKVKEAMTDIGNANTTEALWRASERLRVYRKLLNLPETLILVKEQEDEDHGT